jgi:hypothetical protein
MTYRKFSIFGGNTADGRYKNTNRSGHWKPETALVAARNLGIVGEIEMTHQTMDTSGKGYGGFDRAFIITEKEVRKRPLTAYERGYDDGNDVNDIYDDLETG